MTINNDQLYIEKVLKGDVNSFSYLVDKYQSMVFSLALKVTKSREEAEEISQDTFIKAFKSLERFKGDSKFSTWLYKIAYNNCMDRVKKITRLYNTDTIDEITENKIKSFEDTLQQIERKERELALKKCLDLLPEDERTIIWMFYYEELSLKEIADITALTDVNVKVKLHRARKKMLKIVKENVEPEFISHYERR